jgi:hypothetical protein
MKKLVVPKLANIKVGQDTLDLDYLLNTDFEDVREASEQLPAAIAWLGYNRGYAYERLTIAEQEWNEAEARVYFELRGGGFVEKGYGEKMTEEALKKAVVLDESVGQAALAYASAKRWLEVYNSTIEALMAKLDLVRTSEATRRRLIEVPLDAHEKSATPQTRKTKDE